MVDDAWYYIEIKLVAPFRWRLIPVARNGTKHPVFRTYVTKWNAKRAARRFYPGVEIRIEK